AMEWEVRALYVDEAGRLWVGTNRHGLIRVDQPGTPQQRISAYTSAEGLANNTVRCITADNAGRIYVGVGRGVDRLNPATGHIKHYSTADGLAHTFVNTAFRDHDGDLWFGMLQGLSRLTPEPDQPTPAPQVLLNGLRIAGNPFPLSELGTPTINGIE